MNHATDLLLIGGTLLLALAAHGIGQRIHVPRVTLLLLLGALAGPELLDLLPAGADDHFGFITQLTLAMVGFLLGGQLTPAQLRSASAEVLSVSLVAALVTAVVVGAGLWALGLPLPLAARGGAATAPVPERADIDGPPALLGSHDRRRAHAETRRRALAARSRGVFRTGRSSHRGPLMPSIDKIKPLPPRPREPFAPPRFAVTDVDGSRYELSSRAATSVSHQGGSDAEAAFAREVARDADVETFFDRSIVEAARARPMRGAPRGRQRYNSPYSRRIGPRLRPLEGGGTASVARALASTASAGARSVTSALTVDDFSVASDQPIPYPPSLGRLDEREAQRLDAAVAAARSGTPPVVEARARTPQTPQGTVLVSQRADSGQSLGRIHAENLFGELCAAARTPSPNHLPVATLLEMADGASELKDHPILRAIRSYPVIRKCASKYKPEDPRGLTFLEFDQLQEWFGELIHDYGLDLLPAADAPVAAPPMPASMPAEAAPALAEAPADPELWPDTPLVARSIDPNFRAGYPPRAELKSV